MLFFTLCGRLYVRAQHCTLPTGEEISYKQKSVGGGVLDIDRQDNSGSAPVENIYFAEKPAPGHYKFWVHQYADRSSGGTPFTIRTKEGGQTAVQSFELADGESDKTVWEFDIADPAQQIVQRLQAAGGHEGHITCTLMWDNSNDLDLVSTATYCCMMPQPMHSSAHLCLLSSMLLCMLFPCD